MSAATKSPEKDQEQEKDSGRNPGQDNFDDIIDRQFSPGDERMMEERAKEGAEKDKKHSEDGPSADELGDAEKDGSTPGQSAGDREESSRLGDDGENSFYKKRASQAANNSSKFKAVVAGSRGKVYATGGVTAFIISAVLALLFAFGHSLKLPHLQSSVERRTERVAKDFNRNVAVLTADQVASESDAGVAAALKKKYSGMRSATWGKFDKYRPNQVVKNMKADGVISFEFANGENKSMTAVIFNKGSPQEARIPVAEYKPARLISNYKEKLRFAAQMRPHINQALTKQGANGISGFIVETKVSKTFLKAFGINLRWVEKLALTTVPAAEAEAIQAKESYDKIHSSPLDMPDGAAKTAAVNEGAQAAKADMEKDLADPKIAAQIVEDGGVLPDNVQKDINGAVDGMLGKGVLGGIVGILNPIYSIGVPICMIYDGSTQTSKALINSQEQAAVRTGLSVMSAADQQKKGNVSAEAVGAFNKLVGNIADSIPQKAARGETIDTSAEIGAQSTKTGTYTIFDALFGPFAGIANKIVPKLCPYVTSGTFALTGGALFAILALLGTPEAGAAGKTATTFIKEIAQGIVDKFVTREGRIALKNTAKDFATSSVKSGATTEGLTYFGRMLVLAEYGAFINGVQSNDFANQADMGMDYYNNDMERGTNFGRPLTVGETKGAMQSDSNSLSEDQSMQSNFHRYFATSNPDSLTANAAIYTSELPSKVSQLPSLISDIPHLFGSFFNFGMSVGHPLMGYANAASPAAEVDNANYGIVQWGYSNDEENILNNDSTFDPLENAQALSDNGNSKAILDKYGKCFGVKDDGSGNPVTDDSSSLGGLLSGDSPSIVRDQTTGAVQADSGDCSPNNLSYKNSEFGPMMVFRWRVDMGYQNTLDEMSGVQNPETSTATDNGGGSQPPGNSTCATSPPTLNGSSTYTLTASEAKWLEYVCGSVVPSLKGTNSEKAAAAARVSWWSLKEGILDVSKPENPVGYSNCGDNGSNHIVDFLYNCKAAVWQLGIAAGQINKLSESEVTARALSLHPGETIDQILGNMATDAGHPQGTKEYDAAINSTGRLRVSLILRDPATDFSYEDPAVNGECVAAWNQRDCDGSWVPAKYIASNQQVSAQVIAQLQAYFMGGT